jgi:hypothetical protein
VRYFGHEKLGRGGGDGREVMGGGVTVGCAACNVVTIIPPTSFVD